MSLFRMLLSQQTDDKKTYSTTRSVKVGQSSQQTDDKKTYSTTHSVKVGQSSQQFASSPLLQTMLGFVSTSLGSMSPTSIFINGVEGSIYRLLEAIISNTSMTTINSKGLKVTVNLVESVSCNISYKITRLDTGVAVSGVSSISGESFDLDIDDVLFFTASDKNKTISVKIEITAT